MLLYHLVALLNLFPRIFIIKSNVNKGRIQPSCPFVALMTPFSICPWRSNSLSHWRNHRRYYWCSHMCHHFPQNPPSCFHISCLPVSVALSINRPDFCSKFMNFIIPIFSFEINKANIFPALTAPCLFIFFQIYLIQKQLL